MRQQTLRADGRAAFSSRRALARTATEVFAPAPLAVALLALIAWHSATSRLSGIVSAVIAVLFGSLLPLGYVLRGVRRGRWASHHVPAREQRNPPMLVGLASIATGLVVLLALGAARQLLALVGAMGAGLLVSLAITQVWKMSVHAGVVAGTTVILVMVFGPVALVALPFAALVAWSRVELGDHTVAQVLVGCIVGATVAGLVFSLLS